MRKQFFVVALAGLFWGIVIVQLRVEAQVVTNQPGPIIHRKGLLLSNVTSFRRAGLDRYDALEAYMVREGLATLHPSDGESIDLGDGEPRNWKAVELDEDGAIDRRSLGRGSCLYVPIEMESDRVMVLDASRHDGLFVNGIPHTSNAYGYDYYHIPLHLKAGNNGLLLRAGRRGIKVRLYDPPAVVHRSNWRAISDWTGLSKRRVHLQEHVAFTATIDGRVPGGRVVNLHLVDS